MKNVCVLLAGVVLLVASQAFAQPNSHADDHAIVALGKRVDPQSGKVVEGFAILDYKKGHAKPDHAGGPKNNGGSDCFVFLARSAKWKSVEPFIVDPFNNADLDEDTVKALMDVVTLSWNAEVTTATVFGSKAVGFVDAATIGVTVNGQNEVVFGSIEEPGVIAVTYVWGIFGGKPKDRVLVEWDMKFDDVDFDWSTTDVPAPGAMDFWNIAQHEAGHAGGLGHPDNTCTEETMYAFATTGETKKRDVNAGDIAGIVSLYK